MATTIKDLRTENRYLNSEKTNLIKENVELQFTNQKLALENKKLREQNAQQLELEKHLTQNLKNATNENECLNIDLAKVKSTLNNDNNNSGIPTSKTPIGKKKRNTANSREKSTRTKGGQKGHEKHQLNSNPNDEITSVINHLHEAFLDQIKGTDDINLDKFICPNCIAGISPEKIKIIEKEEIDIQIKKTKTKHRFFKIHSKKCNTFFEVKIPNNLKEAAQYGTNIKALICVLVKYSCVSIIRVHELLRELLGLNISQGYICKICQVFGEKCEDFAKELSSIINKYQICYWDDTTVSANGKNINYRVYGTNNISLYTAHPQKNLNGLIEDNVLSRLSSLNYVMHDHNCVNYNQMFTFQNIKCNQHLLRDFEKIIDNNKDCIWSLKLKNQIKELIKLRNEMYNNPQNKSNSLPTEIIKQFEKLLNKTIETEIPQLEKIKQEYENKQKELGNTSRKIYPPESVRLEYNLLTRLSNPVYKEAYFKWMSDVKIPVTNNLAERLLRPEKTHMKVSGQFASVENAKLHANAMSYLNTCRINGVNPLEAIRALFENRSYTIESLKLFAMLIFLIRN